MPVTRLQQSVAPIAWLSSWKNCAPCTLSLEEAARMVRRHGVGVGRTTARSLKGLNGGKRYIATTPKM